MTEAKPTWNNPIWHRGYRIYYDPPPIPSPAFDWHFVHDEYDGDGDPRHGAEGSVEACKDAIDEMEAECPVCCGTGVEMYEPQNPTAPPTWRPCRNCDGTGESKEMR